MDRIDLAQDKNQWRYLVNTVMNLRFPYNVGKFVSYCITGRFSGKVSSNEFVLWLDKTFLKSHKLLCL
jgi:hypothetical protein